MKRTQIALTFLLISILLFVGCQSSPPDYVYTPPEDFNDGLTVGTIDGAGIDLNTLGIGVDRIRDGDYREVHSVLIYKDGKLVFEEYFPGHQYRWDSPNFHSSWIHWDEGKRHNVMSVGKSYTSAAVGIAIEAGYINSVHDPIFDYLPDYQQYAVGGKQDITIEHLVTMTSGLDWKEWNTHYGDPENDAIGLWFYCEDQIACILDLDLKHKPGTKFNYSGGDMDLLGEIVRNATGIGIDAFAAQHIFEPLDIDPPEFQVFDSGIIDAAGSFYQTPREMMKFGVTYLNNGVWDGQQIIPEEWVALSAMPFNKNTGIHVPGVDGGRKGYGYTWWQYDTRQNGEKLHAYYAGGWGGQKIYVIPALEAVIVFTCGNYTTKTTTFTILERHILPAIE